MILIVIIIYSLFPILSTPFLLILLFLDKKRYKYYLFAIILNLAFIGYHFKPLILDDLFRHFEYIDRFRVLEFKDALTIDPLIFKNIWFYVISLTKNNSLLPFSSIIITYYIILRDILEFSEKEELNYNITISFVIIIMTFLQLIWVMSGVRFATALALFFHGIYKEYILKKRGWSVYIFYVISVFTHYSIVVLLLIRVLVLLKKKISRIIIIVMLTWGYFIDIVTSILSNINIQYVHELSLKAQTYLTYNNESSYMRVTNFIKLFYCIVSIYFYFKLKETNVNIYSKYKSLYDYILLLSLFCIGGYNIFIILDRFGFAVLILLPFMLIPVLQVNKNKIFKQLYILLYIPIILIGIYIQYIPLKATNYSITILEFLNKNLIRMFIKGKG